MTYTFKISRRLASNHRRFLAVASLLVLAGCTAGGNPILTDQPGAITLTINGLANGASPQVTLTGPNGYQKAITHSGTVNGLALGSYEVVASAATAQSTTFTPTQARQSLTITSGAPTAAAAIHYQVATGALDVRIEGLPASTASAVRVEGPGGFTLDLAGSATLRGLAPGSYSLHAAPRSSVGGTWYPAAPLTTVSVAASLTPAVATVRFAQLTGSLVVEMTGLPDGVTGQFILVGPGSYNASLTGAVELTSLNPGQYVATVQPVQFDGHTWAPLQEVIPVTVDTARRVLTIPFDIITGALAIEVSGLPAGVPGQFTVTGPQGFSRSGQATVEYKGLKPGTYTTTAASVEHGGKRYQPRKTSDNHEVTKGRSPKNGRIEYSESTGSLALSVTGLPAGMSGQVIVMGPASVDTMTTSGTLQGLAAGSYTLVASAVGAGGASYAPSPASQVVSVASSGTATAAVAYTASTGSLQLQVSGLPAGTAAEIQVTGPGGYSRSVTGTTTLTPLEPGSYTVAATTVTVEGVAYAPSPATQVVAVSSGATAGASVGHAGGAPAPTAGSLALTVSGLPAGSAAAVTVTGPGGFNHTVTNTGTLNSLAPGTYTIAAASVTVSGTTYAPSPASQSASVTAGATTNRSVGYSATAPASATLIIAVSGLPVGVDAAITVSHATSGFSAPVVASDTVTGFPVPATLTVSAQSVIAAGVTYTPSSSSQTAYMTAGATVTRTIGYTGSASPPPPPASATVTVDTTTRYQVISGWEATAQAGHWDDAYPTWRDALMDLAVNDLGLNRIRLEVRSGSENPVDYFGQYRAGQITDTEWRANRYNPVNDNTNANAINWSGFHFTELDETVEDVVLPMRAALAARGEQLHVNLNYISFGTATGHSNPSEYAEFMLAVFQHLQSRYGFVPDAVEVILEPDNGTIWTGTGIGQLIVAAGARLAAAGFHPDFIAPSVMSMYRAVSWFDEIAAVPGAMTYLTEVAYHRYTGASDATLAAIGSRVASRGVQSAMLEHIGSGVEELYKDLTLANVSAWQQFALAFPAWGDNGAQYFLISGGQPVMASRTKLLRQYFRYVREGAQRVAATSSSSGVRPVAFTNPGGGMAVVLHVDAAGSYTVAGIRPGNYGVELTTLAGSRIQLSNVTAVNGATVTVAPSQTGVLTLYRLP